MNILSVDTTTKKASVTLKADNKIHTKSIDNEITHSEKFLPLIHDVLSTNNKNLKDIDKYLILNGPGSFTGIRISLSTIKAFTQIYKKEIFSISSLEALAYLGFKKFNTKYIATFIDAKNERVYFSLYYLENINGKISIKNLIDVQNEYMQDALDIINKYLKDNKIESYKSVGNFSNDIIDFMTYPSTEDLIHIFEEINNLNDYIYDCFTLNANYARKSQAERILDGKN